MGMLNNWASDNNEFTPFPGIQLTPCALVDRMDADPMLPHVVNLIFSLISPPSLEDIVGVLKVAHEKSMKNLRRISLEVFCSQLEKSERMPLRRLLKRIHDPNLLRQIILRMNGDPEDEEENSDDEEGVLGGYEHLWNQLPSSPKMNHSLEEWISRQKDSPSLMPEDIEFIHNWTQRISSSNA